MRFFLALVLLTIPSALIASEKILGKWVGVDDSVYEFIDGFKVSTGPILVTHPNGQIWTGRWVIDDGGIVTIDFGYGAQEIEFKAENLFVSGFSQYYREVKGSKEKNKISLKTDRDNFISELNRTLWRTSYNGNVANFYSTFEFDSGAVELTDSDGKFSIETWSIASDVFKLSHSIIVEAFISGRYFVGLDVNDNFVVFKNVGATEPQNKSTLSESRELFFDAFLSGGWSSGYSSDIHKFRPIFGELKGRVFTENDDGTFNGYSSWEFSPKTGAIKLRGSNYVQSMLIGDKLAFLDDRGDQSFYYRNGDAPNKRYTLSDVERVPLSEEALTEVQKYLSGQFKDREYKYFFEFLEDNRTGFLHKFKSSPFSITGETFGTDGDIYKSNILYILEDYILFDDNQVFQRDITGSRLKPKTEGEILSGISEEKKRIDKLLEKNLFLVMTLKSGEVIQIPVGIENFDEIQNLQLIRK